jgi:hypothetical protein
MRVVSTDGDSITQTGGDGLSKKNQNRPAGVKTGALRAEGFRQRKSLRKRLSSRRRQLRKKIRPDLATLRIGDTKTSTKIKRMIFSLKFNQDYN